MLLAPFISIALLVLVFIAATVTLAYAAFMVFLALKRRWKLAIGINAILLVLIGAGLLIGMIFFNWSGKVKSAGPKVVALQALSPEVHDWSVIDVEFWTWEGDFDWFRVPIRYPYDLHCIDTLTNPGFLNKNTRAGHSSDPTTDGVTILNGITQCSTDQDFFLFFQQPSDGSPPKWGILQYHIDKVTMFNSQADMLAEAKARGFKGLLPLKSVEDVYKDYWR